MTILRFVLLIAALLVSGQELTHPAFAADSTSRSTIRPPSNSQLSAQDLRRRNEILLLHNRLAAASKLDAAFWRDIKRLDQLMSKEQRIAVVRHLRVLYGGHVIADTTA